MPLLRLNAIEELPDFWTIWLQRSDGSSHRYFWNPETGEALDGWT